MRAIEVKEFLVIGISVRTTNKNEQAKNDIGLLWSKFIGDNVSSKISNKVDDTIYAVYTDYVSDHTEPYTTILGYRVDSLDNIPEGMTGKMIESASYSQFTAKGDLTDNVVVDQWTKIWKMDLDRVYTSDFETYGEKAIDPTNGEVDIFIAVK